MKRKLNLLIGLIVLAEIIYYGIKCPTFNCDETILGFHVPAKIYLAIWVVTAIGLLYDVYKENSKKKKV